MNMTLSLSDQVIQDEPGCYDDIARILNFQSFAPICDICGGRDQEAVFHDETHIVLCRDCFSYLSALPSFSIEVIQRRLVGNVV